MFHLFATAWLAGTNPGEGDDRIHHLALHEARAATDFRQHRAEDAAMAESQERRLRFSLRRRADAGPDLTACCA